MSPLRRTAHERARELAALRVDEPLAPTDASWLDTHLAGCPACAAVAGAYLDDRALFVALRDVRPVPPRDLWARTAAAIDATSPSTRRSAGRDARRVFGMPVASLAPVAGLAVLTVVVGTVLINGTPAAPGPIGRGPGPTAMAVVPGDIAVVTRDEDGRLHVLTAGVDEVCPLVAGDCEAAEPSFETAALAGIGSSDNIDAILSPARDRIVVVQRDASGSDGVFVVPVGGTDTVAGTPRPTTEPASPIADPDPSSASPGTASSPSDPPASSSPTAAPSREPSPSPSLEASPSPSAPPSGEPPTASPTEAATPSPTDLETEPPTATPDVEVTPAPDGTIEIAKDVVVVGGVAAYSPDGSRFAFTARPADDSVGPDVYVWDTDETRAHAVTSDHRSMFAAWDRGDLLVSRVVDGTPRTVALNPRTGAELGERGEAAWLPTVSPDGGSAAWWAGSVRLAADGVTWVPDAGRLVIGPWPGDPDAAQVLARGAITAWEVQWAPDGSAVAAWTSGVRSDEAGRLSLYAVDADTGKARLEDPLLRDEPAFAGFALEPGRLAYAAPARGGERTVWVLAWDGESVGKVELPGDATVVR